MGTPYKPTLLIGFPLAPSIFEFAVIAMLDRNGPFEWRYAKVAAGFLSVFFVRA
jgi:hypothetical protein